MENKEKPAAWHYATDGEKVVFMFENQPDVIKDRSEFKNVSDEIFVKQVAEDFFEPFTPTEQEYKEAEIKFWDKYYEN